LPALDVTGEENGVLGASPKCAANFGARAEQDVQQSLGAGDDELGCAGLEPDRWRCRRGRRAGGWRRNALPDASVAVDLALDELPQARAADVLAELGVLGVDHVRRTRDAPGASRWKTLQESASGAWRQKED